MSNKYRKKPIVVEVVRWEGLNLSEVECFVGYNIPVLKDNTTLEISTLEGGHEALLGDYIIKGVQGEFYPCKPDIFEQTYEMVE